MSSWTYPISGEIAHFPPEEISFDSTMHYFTRAKEGYSVSGVLRSMALFVDGLPDTASVEAVMIYPEGDREGWAGMVAVYKDKPARVRAA